MEIEKKFVRNYLSKQKYASGKISAFFLLTLCLISSLFYWDSSSFISPFLSAGQENVLIQKEYWRLFSTSFVHGDIHHLMSNSLMLFILTYFVTSFYGVKISLILTPIIGAFINFLVIKQYATETTLVGASGIVYYLWGFWLILYLLITRHISLFKRMVRVFGIFLILLVPTTYSPTTSYMAHYIGFVLGILVGAIYFLMKHKTFEQYEFWEYRVVPDFEGNEKNLEPI